MLRLRYPWFPSPLYRLLSRGSGSGWLTRSGGPTSRGAALGGLGLLPSLLAPLDAGLIPGLAAFIRSAPLLTTIPATILLKFLVVARGRKGFVIATFSAFLSHIPLVTSAQLGIGTSGLIQYFFDLFQRCVILLDS